MYGGGTRMKGDLEDGVVTVLAGVQKSSGEFWVFDPKSRKER